MQKAADDNSVLALIRAIIRDDAAEVAKLLRASPSLARQALALGASRDRATDFYFKEIPHYLYAGDTALHAAAAAYRHEIARALIKEGADASATNRRGAQPLHYAADGSPGGPNWNPRAQAETIALLIKAGADANALDKSGVAPLHRAVRQRCPGAVDSLLRNGAEVRLKNKSGSTPLHLAVQNTGRGGSGSAEAKACQKEIIEILLKAGGSPNDRDGNGKSVKQCAQADWVRAML
jgi:ankyrin repeat protein